MLCTLATENCEGCVVHKQELIYYLNCTNGAKNGSRFRPKLKEPKNEHKKPRENEGAEHRKSAPCFYLNTVSPEPDRRTEE